MEGISHMNEKSMNKRDVLIASVMTLIYLIIALVNLGSFTIPQTGWEPKRVNESFTVDFGREVDIDKIMLFGGLGHAWGCFGTLQIEAFQNGQYVPYTFIDMKSVFRWQYSTDKVRTSKLRITNQYMRSDEEGDKNRYFQAEYRELAFFSGSTIINGFTVTDVQAETKPDKLFDEQAIVPERPSYMNGTYFDEIYFPRTAYEELEHYPILYENTHPPLGKYFISLGIAIFGMNPFGWRIIGTIFGALLIPLMYMIAKRLFKDSFWAFFCGFLMMFDFMHFTQTRLATIDSYTVFFVMATYYFMLKYYDTPAYEKGFFKSLIPLLLSGIFLGLGAVTKWIALYGAFGIAVIFFISRGFEYREYNRKLNAAIRDNQSGGDDRYKSLNSYLGKYFYATCLFCILFFIIIPAVIYVCSFIPIENRNDGKSLIVEVIDSIKSMYNYHKGVVAPHPYSSTWYQWPIMVRPIFYYQGALLPEGTGSSISSFGNPFIWWTGLIAFFTTLWLLITRKFSRRLTQPDESRPALFAVIGYLSLYVPWIIAPRKLTFIYHYFACVPFLIIMMAVVFQYLERANIIKRWVTHLLMGLVLLLFIIYYPVLSGLEVPRGYLNVLQLLPSWSW